MIKKSDGGSTDYYKLPKTIKAIRECIQLINALQMNFAQGNIQKALWRICSGGTTDALYDYNKIIFFANSEIKRIKEEKKNESDELSV